MMRNLLQSMAFERMVQVEACPLVPKCCSSGPLPLFFLKLTPGCQTLFLALIREFFFHKEKPFYTLFGASVG